MYKGWFLHFALQALVLRNETHPDALPFLLFCITLKRSTKSAEPHY